MSKLDEQLHDIAVGAAQNNETLKLTETLMQHLEKAKSEFLILTMSKDNLGHPDFLSVCSSPCSGQWEYMIATLLRQDLERKETIRRALKICDKFDDQDQKRGGNIIIK